MYTFHLNICRRKLVENDYVDKFLALFYKNICSCIKSNEIQKNHYMLASLQVNYAGMCFIFKHLGGYLHIKPDAAHGLAFIKEFDRLTNFHLPVFCDLHTNISYKYVNISVLVNLSKGNFF